MNKKNIILFFALILGFIIFFSSIAFLSYLTKFIRIVITILLLIDVVIILVYTTITWWESKKSLSDPFCGVRLEILGGVIIFIIWAFATNFI